jgi:hypothetical protein
MKLVIDHLTRYGYDEEVKFSTQYLRLTPRSTGRQICLMLSDRALILASSPLSVVCRSACARSSRVLKRRLYRQPVSRETVMELLILRNDIPRSLRASIADLVRALTALSRVSSR